MQLKTSYEGPGIQCTGTIGGREFLFRAAGGDLCLAGETSEKVFLWWPEAPTARVLWRLRLQG